MGIIAIQDAILSVFAFLRSAFIHFVPYTFASAFAPLDAGLDIIVCNEAAPANPLQIGRKQFYFRTAFGAEFHLQGRRSTDVRGSWTKLLSHAQPTRLHRRIHRIAIHPMHLI